MTYAYSIGGASSAKTRAEIGAQVVTKTLDYLNRDTGAKSGGSQAVSSSYKFNMDVLSAAYSPKGRISSVFT